MLIVSKLYSTQKWWGRKPLSVFEFVIYLRNLPPGKERAALICRYIWSCRPVGGTHCMLPCSVVSSCLAFSPLPSEEGGSFLLPLAKDYSLLRFPQTGALSCADFPQRACPSMTGARPRAPRQIVPPFIWAAKIMNFLVILQCEKQDGHIYGGASAFCLFKRAGEGV